jgi:YbgC/YbaW family acyl-CoA thioester hydrolase
MPAQPFTVEEYVRWSDVDLAGIIFYGSYVRFFELAETELFRAAGLPYSTLFETYDIYLPRVQVHTEFHYPPRLDDQLQVAAYFGRIGNKSLTMNFEVIHTATGALRAWAPGAGLHRPSQPGLPSTAEGMVERIRPFALSIEDARRQLGIAK